MSSLIKSLSMRNKSSPVWEFFTVIVKTNAKCNRCKLQMSYKSSI